MADEYFIRKARSLVDNCDSTTGWATSTDGSISLNTLTKKEGSGSLSLAKTGTTQTFVNMTKTVSSFDWTGKNFYVWVYVEDKTDLVSTGTAITLAYGNDISNYYYLLVDISNISNGWNYFTFNSSTATGSIGSVTDTAMDFAAATFTVDNAVDTIAANRLLIDGIRIGIDGDYEINSFSFKKELERSINSCDISIAKTLGENFSIGDEAEVGKEGLTLFAGKISDKKENLDIVVTIESYGAIINHVQSEEIYDNKSPEFIAEDLITTYTDLNYASSDSSGISIKRFVSNTELISDNFKLLVELLSDWHIRSDNNKNFYFEPKETTFSSESIVINENAYLTNQWNRNPDKIVNKITLVGDVQTFSTDQDGFTATGGETTTTLSYKPRGNVKITKNGTELLGGVEDGTGSPDFTVDRDNAVVTYATPLIAADVITIFYEYEVPIKVTAQNDASIEQFGERATKIDNKNIRTMDDARIFVQNYLVTNSLEDISGEFFVDINRNINVGEILPIVDDFNNIDQDFLVRSVEIRYPEGRKIIKVGRLSFDSLMNDKEIKDRLKKLEQQFDNSDLLQLYRSIVEKLNIQLPKTYKYYTREIDNSWIAGSSTNAIVGTWTGTAGGGQLVVGPTNNTIEVIGVFNDYNIFRDFYDSNNYVDESSSTATLNTVDGQIEFTSGEIAVSEDIYLHPSVGAVSATATVNTTSGSVGLELTNDGGVTWENATSGTKHTFTNTDFTSESELLLETGDSLLLETGDSLLLDGFDKSRAIQYRLTENAASTAVVKDIKVRYTT